MPSSPVFARLSGIVLLATFSLGAAGCLSRGIAPVQSPASDPSAEPPCGGVVDWQWMNDPEQRAILDRWCVAVGPPVVHPATPDGSIERLIIVSWNMHVGGGRLKTLVELMQQQALDGPRTGFVFLLQEAFRAGAEVPGRVPPDARVPDAIRPHRPAADIVTVARELEMALAYVPSMRNGGVTSVSEREDRGSAVLSTEPLEAISAIELPFGRQRRVAVAAIVLPRGGRVPTLRVVSAHLDVGPHRFRQARHLADRLAADRGTGHATVLGIDANATNGVRDRAVRAIVRVLPLESCGTGRLRRWPWPPRIDFIFSDLPARIGRRCTALRSSYGSDHRPLVLALDMVGGPGDRRQ